MLFVYFAWGCFRDFVSRPGGSPPKPRPGHTRSLARGMGTLSAFRRRPLGYGGQVALHPAILGLRVRRQRGGAFAERALHHHRVEPAAEFEADIGMGPDHLKSGPGMDADRAGIGGIADHRDHLAIAPRLALSDQP